jgi:hypothetical protein
MCVVNNQGKQCITLQATKTQSIQLLKVNNGHANQGEQAVGLSVG